MKLNLGELTPGRFLSDYWQKRPLLIRQGLEGFGFDLDANDLAGLAMEEDVESRIVWESRHGKPWQPENGPFDERTLSNMPDRGWTLLIQGLDHWHRPLAALLDLFRFIPNWRLDDIMASVSPDGASVGPHFDYYDVFLIQAEGRKRWHVGPVCDETSPRVAGTPLRILADMAVTDSWVLEPGDILYLPPGVAHHGIADGFSITLSVGFRSPTLTEVASAWLDQLELDAIAPLHVDDLVSTPQSRPGWLDPRVVRNAREALVTQLLTESRLTRTLLRLSTEPKHSGIVIPPEEQVTISEVADAGLQGWLWNEGSRYVYTRIGDTLCLAVDGTLFDLPHALEPFAAALSARSAPDLSVVYELSADDQELAWSVLTALINQGSLVQEAA
ncbi:cupin domain-containing protein [Hahella sp. SMD15-11]|uniref:Cupin domain-containing protein n=1 Tax=Thermohahella caldifontis TaxID=3142973 RepID=A0AB39UX08_9GAMM